MYQIAQQVALRAQENQKSHENVNVVKTRSEKVDKEKEDGLKFDDNIIEVEQELRENKKNRKKWYHL